MELEYLPNGVLGELDMCGFEKLLNVNVLT